MKMKAKLLSPQCMIELLISWLVNFCGLFVSTHELRLTRVAPFKLAGLNVISLSELDKVAGSNSVQTIDLERF